MYDDCKGKTSTTGNTYWAEVGVKMLKIILCDDNPCFLEKLRENIRAILKRNKQDSVIYAYSSMEDIPIELISQTNMFFLDIDFASHAYTGIDIARRIRSQNRNTIIIFVTNYIQYAPDGYEVQAFRYLLKSDISTKLEHCLLQAIERLTLDDETMMITVAGETIVLPLTDILYLEAQAHNVSIFVQAAGETRPKQYRIYATLSSMEQQLGNQGFLRIQKSYLVNMRRLSKYQCTEAVLDTGMSLRVSQKIYSEQKKKYLLWKGRQ